MSKSKFLKKLLIGGLCALTATAMIGATACNKDGDDDKKKPDPNPVETTDQWTVTFNLEGGTWSNGNNYSLKVDKGGKLPAPATLGTPSKEGYDFKGWWNGTTEIVPGVTPITSTMTVKARWELKQQAAAKTGVFTVSNTSTDTYAKGDAIADNELFTLKAGEAVTYGKGKDNADLGVSVTNADGGITANQALKQSDNVVNGTYAASLYEVTAKANATVKILVHFVNDSWNSNRANADITWSLGSGAVQTKKSTNRTEALVAIEASIPEGETLHIGVNNTAGQDGKLWLFSVEGTEEQNKVEVNYYNGAEEENSLILTQYVASGAEVVAPTTNPVTISYTSKFLGWYDAATDGNEYTFGEVSATTSIYAHYKASDATVTYYAADGENVYETVDAYIGEATTAISGTPTHSQGAEFKHWSTTADGEAYDFATVLTGDLSLYPVYEEIATGTFKREVGLSSDISSSGNNVYTVTNDDSATVATITVITSSGSKKTNSGVACGDVATVDVEWQSGASDGKVVELKLEDGYTYTVEMYLGSSGSSARTVDLYKVVPAAEEGGEATNVKQGETQTTGNGTKVTTDCKWTGLGAGNYYLQQSANIMICYFVITATPVANS